jgi:type III pantothenate kinase
MALVAVDIGNTRIKLGLFTAPAANNGLATPDFMFAIPSAGFNEQGLADWVSGIPHPFEWWIVSVNRAATARLTGWIDEYTAESGAIKSSSGAANYRLLEHTDLPITAAVEFPSRVGIDRLAGAAAANRLRTPLRPAVVIGVGTAITVDLVNSEGVFCGGAILPGIGVSARALNEFTDLLPRSPLQELSGPPPALGTSTMEAIHSGLYWGAVGAMRELTNRLAETLGPNSPAPEVFLTGGAAQTVAAVLDPQARYVEHLVLSGIALAKPSAPV